MNARLYISAILIATSTLSFSQSLKEDDERKFNETIEWLESWLSYAYYNSESDVNWSSRFFFNRKTNTISLRSVSTDSPNKAIKKKVLDRTVRIDHLDAQSITLTKVDKNRGRIVEGTSIKINTIGNKREIQRSFNGSASLKETYLEIPIPKYFEDSVQGLSNSIKNNMALAIDLASKVYPSPDTLADIGIILKVFSGDFKGTNGRIRAYNSILNAAIESNESVEGKLVEKEIVGYNEKSHTFFRWSIKDQKAETMELAIDTIEQLVLFSKENKYKLTIHGMHDFTIEKDGTTVDYHRVGF